MEQIVDLQNDTQFQALDVDVVSIAFDSQQELSQGADQYGIFGIPLLTDSTHEVSETYDVLQWAVGTGEPGHTFVLVDGNGNIAWIRDYGAPENGGVMYVPVIDLASQVSTALNR